MNIKSIIIHPIKDERHYDKVLNKYTDYVLKATVVFKDGTKKEVSYEEAQKLYLGVRNSRNLTHQDMKEQGLIHFAKQNEYNSILNNVTAKVNKSGKVAADEVTSTNINKKLKKKKLSPIKRFRKAAALATLAAVLGIGGCAVTKKNISEDTVIEKSINDENELLSFANMDFNDLIKNTNNIVQKEAMNRRYDVITYLNGKFADYYLESDKDIRFGLQYRELEALDLAYNNYTAAEIQAIYNGTKIDARELANAYKSGTLMMMGAYTLSDANMPVKGYELIKDADLKDECKRWEERFYAIKSATGEEKLSLLSDFYEDINSLFPITEDVRTEGLAHYDTRADLDYELLSFLTPMVAACEQMYQNLDVDVTLNDQAIEFINDLGVCNYIEDKYEDYEDNTKCCNFEADLTNPTGADFERAITDYLVFAEINVIDDAHRDISQYDRFQDAVNWHFEYDEYGYYSGVVYSTETYQVEEKWSETTTNTTTRTESKVRKEGKNVTRDEAVKAVGEDKVKEVDDEIDKWNKEQKEEGERKAKEEKERLQEEENRNKERIDKEVEDENKNKEQEILDNLPDWVDKDSVSTDPGTSTNLPDPQESGKNLDNNEPPYTGSDAVTPDHIMDVESIPTTYTSVETTSTASTSTETSSSSTSTETTTTTSNNDLPDPKVTGAEFDAIADTIVEEMANHPTAVDEGYQYTK